MQAQPYLVVEGTVVGSRVVDVEEQQPREYKAKDGSVKQTVHRPASQFTEVGVNCPGLLNGKVEPGVVSVQSVRWPSKDAPAIPAKGTVVRWAVQAAQLKVWPRGGGAPREWIVYYFAGEAPPSAASTAERPHLVATGS